MDTADERIASELGEHPVHRVARVAGDDAAVLQVEMDALIPLRDVEQLVQRHNRGELAAADDEAIGAKVGLACSSPHTLSVLAQTCKKLA